jgi:hypothetical protein
MLVLYAIKLNKHDYVATRNYLEIKENTFMGFEALMAQSMRLQSCGL